MGDRTGTWRDPKSTKTPDGPLGRSPLVSPGSVRSRSAARRNAPLGAHRWSAVPLSLRSEDLCESVRLRPSPTPKGLPRPARSPSVPTPKGLHGAGRRLQLIRRSSFTVATMRCWPEGLGVPPGPVPKRLTRLPLSYSSARTLASAGSCLPGLRCCHRFPLGFADFCVRRYRWRDGDIAIRRNSGSRGIPESPDLSPGFLRNPQSEPHSPTGRPQGTRPGCGHRGRLRGPRRPARAAPGAAPGAGRS